MDEKKYELIICIVNDGFNEHVVSTAKKHGAKGGTVINARGTANEELATKFNFSITPEKEIVLLVVLVEIKEDLLHSLYREVGFNTQAQGVIFTVPVEETAGIGKHSAKGEKAEEVSYEEYMESKGISVENTENKEETEEK